MAGVRGLFRHGRLMGALALLVALGATSGCAGPWAGGDTIIDWLNFVQFGGIMYLGSATPGRDVQQADVGVAYDTVRFNVSNVHDASYQIEDGDASALPVGTTVYAMRGYAPTFRLVAMQGDRLTLFEADTNPSAEVGADLLDIGGKVRSVTVSSVDGGNTAPATIDEPTQVRRLVASVLAAPVDQRREVAGGAEYFIAFHLADGTQTVRAYSPQSGELARGIWVGETFAGIIAQAVSGADTGS